MSIPHVRSVPDDLYERLRLRAQAERRSLSAEAVILLTWAIDEADRLSAVSLESIRARRTYEPAAAGAPDSTAMLREDRGR